MTCTCHRRLHQSDPARPRAGDPGRRRLGHGQGDRQHLRLRCPILAIFGAEDVHVPTEPSVAAYEAAFARSGHTEHQIVVFPGADHRILVPDPATGRHRRAPGLFELIATWLARTLDS